jgi:transposase InsO family protein
MPWKDCCTMSLREEFVTLAQHEQANISSLCRRFNISRKTGYKWIARFARGGGEALRDQARRPRGSPRRCDEQIEAAIVQVRRAHPAWGGRKIRRVLINRGADEGQLPAPSTIGQVLLRRGLIDPSESAKHRAFIRFEQAAPNDLWQMDFKGHVPLRSSSGGGGGGGGGGGRCHPLTVLDDHSRFNLVLRACGAETRATVQPILIELFQRYGQPRRILCDNGAPWGSSGGEPYTLLGVWLLLHGIGITHARAAASSADAGEGRAFPSHAQRRAAAAP